MYPFDQGKTKETLIYWGRCTFFREFPMAVGAGRDDAGDDNPFSCNKNNIHLTCHFNILDPHTHIDYSLRPPALILSKLTQFICIFHIVRRHNPLESIFNVDQHVHHNFFTFSTPYGDPFLCTYVYIMTRVSEEQQ
jgi:hypothetical protein